MAIALLVLAGAAGCKKNSDIQEPELQPSGKMRTVTIKAGQGATKTSVNNGKLTWTAGDELTIVPQSGSIEPASLDITGGAGTNNGTFTGVIDAAIEDNTPLYGYAGGGWSYNAGTFTVNMPATQTYKYNGLAENAYPSIGSGSIQNGITLSNPFGVLKLVVKGEETDLVKSITVTSTANNLAGSFTVVPGGSVSGGSSKTITLGSIPNVALSASGVAFYVVVPAGSYAANDLTVTVTKSDDTKLFDCTLDATTVEAGKAAAKDVQGKPVTKGKAYATAVGEDVEWVQLWAGGPKWAVYNVGATSVGDYGEYYTWGGSTNKSSTDYAPESVTTDIQYNDTYDTARKKWGDNWQMPKKTDFDNLLANCTVTAYFGDDTYQGKNGILCMGKEEYSDNSVFFPAAGGCVDGNVGSTGEGGSYWSSTPYSSYYALYLFFNSYYQDWDGAERFYGFSVRAVLHE